MEQHLDVHQALSYLKAGYVLSPTGEEKRISYRRGKVILKGENDTILIDPYVFLDLYKDSFFRLVEDALEEDIVDPIKDREYYSWRQ